MNQMVIHVALVLMATLAMVSAKCDVMKEFKPDFDEISKLSEKRCKESPKILEADMAKSKKCYNKIFVPLLRSELEKKFEDFFKEKVFGSPCIVCKDKACPNNTKKHAIKDIGMKNSTALNKEVEADCPEYKAAFKSFNSCINA